MTTPARKTEWTLIEVFFVLSSVLQFPVARGTLTPNGTVSLYSGSQQTFTCNVTGIVAVWTISGLNGICVTGNNGLLAANNNPRITTSDTRGITPSSTITITGFTAADNGGTIQCINLADGKDQGKATISIGALTPAGSVSIYNGKQQTFTCSVSGAAAWTITGLWGIAATKSPGLVAANNPRITTTDASYITPSSTITISGFTITDNGGTIQCIELANKSVQGTATISIDMLSPDGIVPVYCGSTQTFICRAPGKPLGWNITGLSGINIPGSFLARIAGILNLRITSPDTGGNSQVSVSIITISGFSASDNRGTIQCINMKDGSVQGTATILIESPLVPIDQAAVNVTVLEGGRAIFTCKPKYNNAVDLISWSLTSAEGVHTEVNSNHRNVMGSSGLFLSPDRTQLLIIGVQNSLNGTRVECSPASANAAPSSICTETVYISVRNFSTVSPALIRKITLSSRLAVVLVWSVPGFVVDYIDGSVISVVMLTPSGLKTIQQTTVGKQVRAYTVYIPERGASYQVTIHMTMNGLHSRPLTVEVNL